MALVIVDALVIIYVLTIMNGIERTQVWRKWNLRHMSGFLTFLWCTDIYDSLKLCKGGSAGT